MSTSVTPKMLAFSSPELLNVWLKENHDTQTELLVQIFKKGSGVQSVTWNDVVIESLCWGWIDGVKRSLDDVSYVQRITPRKPKSVWSKRNTEHVKRLINEGRMQEAGLLHVREAKADGRWEKAYKVSELEVPEDFLAALENTPKAKIFYETLTKSSRSVIAYGLESAKKPETRQKRFNKYMDMLNNEEKPN